MYIYLASPYSDPNEKVMKHRYEQLHDVALTCFLNQVPVFSPILHWHPTSLQMGNNRPYSFEHFRAQNYGMIFQAHELWVLCLPGWQQSKGVAEEMRFATDLSKRVVLLEEDQVESECISIRQALDQRLSSLLAKPLEKTR